MAGRNDLPVSRVPASPRSRSRKSNPFLRAAAGLLQHLHEGVLITDPDGVIAYVNPRAEELSGRSADELYALSLTDLLVHDGPDGPGEPFRLDVAMAQPAVAVMLRRPHQTTLPALLRAAPLHEDGRWYGALVAITDLTEQQHLHAQIERAQRYIGLGTLAAGIAHDFNNCLTAVLGYCQLVRRSIPSMRKEVEELDIAIAEAKRAAALVRQLLAYGREPAAQRCVVDLVEITASQQQVISRIIPETIRLEVILPPNSIPILADPSQVQQVTLNLILNARDAMPSGGKLSLCINELDARDPQTAQDLGVTPNRYATVAVADTGSGIAPEIQERIFDPFFSTKPVEQGTGLGLSVVREVVRQHGGLVRLQSTPGSGSTFTVYWPKFYERRARSQSSSSEHPLSGTETVLLIEDDAAARGATREMLVHMGYTALVAASGEEGVELLREHRDAVALVVSDLVLPGLRGALLLQALRAVKPRVPILFVSGYATAPEVRTLQGAGMWGIVQKPLEIVEFSHHVRRAIKSGA